MLRSVETMSKHIAVASIGDFNRQGNVVHQGVRLIRMSDMAILDCNLSSIRKLLLDGGIVDLAPKEDGVAWTNGSVERYPLIINGYSLIPNEKGKLHSKNWRRTEANTVTVMYVVLPDSEASRFYVVTNVNGKVIVFKEAMFVEALDSEMLRLSNGKVVNRDGRNYISPIKGEYAEIDTESLKRIKEYGEIDFRLRYTNNFKCQC
jgi:hypothetical protein